MSEETVFGRILTSLSVMVAGLAAHAAELPHLQTGAQRLQQLNDQAVDLNTAQEAAKAQLHDVTEQVYAAFDQIREELNRARNGVRSFYGVRSHKLEEFGVAPRSSRPRKPVAEPPATLGG